MKRKCVGAADDADRRDQRDALRQPGRLGADHEALEVAAVEADLQLQELRSGVGLLQRALDAILERRRARVLDCAEEEVRRRVDRAAGEVATAADRPRGREQLWAVEVEDAARLGLVAGGDVVAGQAADVLDPVQRGADDVGLQAEPVPVAADELHDRLRPQLLQRDRNRQR